MKTLTSAKDCAPHQKLVGQSLEALSLVDRWALYGLWIARALYSPDRLPLRIIEAVGTSAADCMQQLQSRGMNPATYEYEHLPQPYEV